MLCAEDLCFSYKHTDSSVIDHLSFRMEPGEALVFVGPNGTGKSTVLSLLAGIQKPSSGTVRTGGRIGYVPQGTGLFEDMTVEENLGFFSRLAGSEIPETFLNGLQPHMKKKVRQLSGGLAKRVSIACALAGDPEIVLFDEPCTGLDIISRDWLQETVLDLKNNGRSVIYACHEAAEFEPFYDWLIFMGRKPYRKYSRNEMGDLSRTYLELFKGRHF